METSKSKLGISRFISLALVIAIIMLGAVVSFRFLPLYSSMPTTSGSTASVGFTVADELRNLGQQTWEIELYFPSFGMGSIIDAIRGSSSCPCQVLSVTQPTPDTVQIVAANGITITSTPSIGYEKIVIGPSFQRNNFMPGVLPGDIFEHWQNASVFRFSGLVTPFASSDIQAYVSYGKATLARGGVVVTGYGTYAHYTSSRMSDPHPGSFFFQFGWTSTPRYVLFVAKTSTQDFSALALPNGVVVPTPVSVSTGAGCSSFTYLFDLSGTQVTLNMEIQKDLVGTLSSCAGEIIGSFSDSLGQSGEMWALADR